MFNDNLLRGKDAFDEKQKICMALQEAKRIKRLISHLRLLFRSTNRPFRPASRS